MAITVGELARQTGITVRTLHHYDERGLVVPSQRTAAGYRLYTTGDVLRLQQVLVLRELGMPLDDIAGALAAAGDDRAALLRDHRAQLIARRHRLDAMVASVDAALTRLAEDRGEDRPMTSEDWTQMFEGFDPATHDAEARARWGDTEAYRESSRRTARYTPADWARHRSEREAIVARLVALQAAGAPATDPAVQAAVEDHRLLIDRWFYPCPVAMHQALGAMYVADPRFTDNLDRAAPGFAQYLADGIAASG